MSDLAMPRFCVVCGRNLCLWESCVCLCCRADLPFTGYENRIHNPMADRYNRALNSRLRSYEPYQYATALLFYDSFTGHDNITQALKYRRDFKTGRYFSDMLACRLADSELFRDVDLVVPVPLFWKKRWKRGYNQAETIASRVAWKLGARLEPRLLRRIRQTRSQTDVDIRSKAGNVLGAFRVDGTVAASCCGIRHILLVDDVFTTGSTLAECHTTIRTSFGAEVRISVATIACVDVD